MVKLIQTKHVRVFGRERYTRITDILPWRRARTLAKQLRASGEWKARVDSHQGGSAIWGRKIPESEIIKVRSKGLKKVATTRHEATGYNYVLSEIGKGRGVKVQKKRNLWVITSWKMRKVIQPKAVIKKKLKSTSSTHIKGVLIRRATEDPIFVVSVSQKVKLRKSMFSNSTEVVELSGEVIALPYWEEEGFEGYSLRASVTVGEWFTYESVDSVKEGVSWIKGIMSEVASSQYFINDAQWRESPDVFDDLISFSDEELGHSFWDIFYERAKEYHWDR